MNAIQEFLFHCEFEKRLSEKTLKFYLVDLKQLETYMSKHYELKDVSKNLAYRQIKTELFRQLLQLQKEYKDSLDISHLLSLD